ncbi:MAG: glutamate 5-kinase [Myxococcales bacterium]|nr:glutamate 5-kinase [Myxococcales bacterium]
MSEQTRDFGKIRRLVVKVGSRVLVGDGMGVMDRRVFADLVQSIATVRANGIEVVLVSSGAVALGRRRLLGHQIGQGTSLAKLQAYAALGQSALMQLYEHEFSMYNLLVGQVLLTQGDIDDRRRFINARHTLRLLASDIGAVPIVNENDTVANDELRLGDNDRLAGLVATLFEADLLLILSDVQGVFTSNPDVDPAARRLVQVDSADPLLDGLVWKSPTGPGRGGMATKLEAARMVSKIGTSTIVAPGREPSIIDRILSGEPLGTMIVPPESSIGARRLWLLHGVQPAGRLTVDDGAARALKERGKSLLPSGVSAVEGTFGQGAAVEIVTSNGEVIGRGLVCYGSQDLVRIAGKQSAEIVQILGYKHMDAVVHRDDLALSENR